MPLTPMRKGYRIPGSGRVRGTPNKASVAALDLCDQLVNDPAYQKRFRADFRARRVHPTIEALVWNYHAGKPKERIDITATLDVSVQLAAERRAFAALELDDLEPLLARSQAIADDALRAYEARTFAPGFQETERKSSELLGISIGSDNTSFVNQTKDSDSRLETFDSQQLTTDGRPESDGQHNEQPNQASTTTGAAAGSSKDVGGGGNGGPEKRTPPPFNDHPARSKTEQAVGRGRPLEYHDPADDVGAPEADDDV